MERKVSPAAVVRVYYEILTGGIAAYDPERLRKILAPELHFEGPIAGSRVGTDPFLKGVSGFIETVQSLRLLHQIYDDGGAAVLYDAKLPHETVRFAEFFVIDSGIISSLRLLYDADRYRSAGGR
ncbi:MAG: nuclear transport factor 2 family protein [Terriglobales bacterium]